MSTAKKIGKVVLIVLLSIIGFVVLVWGGTNLAKFAIYSEYYSVKTDVCDIPGTNDGFVCQGITYVEEEEKILVTGYMSPKSASRIYVTDTNSQSYYVSLKNSNGKDYTGHAGGIAYHGDKIYISNGSAIHVVNLQDVLNAQNGDAVTIQYKINVHTAASFIYADENYVYVGEFHDGGEYETSHVFGENHAVIERFSISSLPTSASTATPDKVYSIRNNIQGVCFANGKIVLSASWGITDSHYYVYDEADAYDSGEDFYGADVYFLGECKRDLKGPAMAEGLDYMDGKVITLTESASNKYIFGKFFFAFKITALNIL